MAAALIIASARHRGRRYRFETGSISIGRCAGNDLVLNDAGVSRVHARLHRQGGQWMLSDCGSANGTALNGTVLDAARPLQSGDRIRVGPIVFRFDPGSASHPEARRFSAAACAAALLLLGAAYEAFARPGLPASRPQAQAGWTVGPASGDDGRAQTGAAPAGAVAQVGPRAGDVEGARVAYQRARRKLDERRIAPRNLFDAWTALIDARAALDGATRESAFAAEVAQSIRLCEQDLARECSRLLFAAARLERYGDKEQALEALREALLRFPGEDPSSCRRKAQERIAAMEESP
ncbi:MAG TPA: FHA domain-containing protein [Myxococcales bacterium]|nr:FHA domain-containing protein [Myxococcales bacterium]